MTRLGHHFPQHGSPHFIVVTERRRKAALATSINIASHQMYQPVHRSSSVAFLLQGRCSDPDEVTEVDHRLRLLAHFFQDTSTPLHPGGGQITMWMRTATQLKERAVSTVSAVMTMYSSDVDVFVGAVGNVRRRSLTMDEDDRPDLAQLDIPHLLDTLQQVRGSAATGACKVRFVQLYLDNTTPSDEPVWDHEAAEQFAEALPRDILFFAPVKWDPGEMSALSPDKRKIFLEGLTTSLRSENKIPERLFDAHKATRLFSERSVYFRPFKKILHGPTCCAPVGSGEPCCAASEHDPELDDFRRGVHRDGTTEGHPDHRHCP